MHAPAEVIKKFNDLAFGAESGIGSWLTEKAPAKEIVFERLGRLVEDPLSKVQLNQLLVVSGIASISDGFFQYYWLDSPDHTYDLNDLQAVDPTWINGSNDRIRTLEHLHWGLYRLYIDALLYFGNIKAGFQSLRSLRYEDITAFFTAKRFDTIAISKRGPSLQLCEITKDDRYLISEMACKSYGKLPNDETMLEKALLKAWREHQQKGGGPVKIRDLITGDQGKQSFGDSQMQFEFSVDGILDESVASEEEILARYKVVAAKFEKAREAALQNTKLYLSVVNDLDVYVATSMRSREDFRRMASTCEGIFSDRKIASLHLRYFDPTMSAAEGHEDKGLIECLMVKCAKVLVYSAGQRESYGKDAEAAMALSLGKPVIFLCDASQRAAFYKDVHPLSRLIDFRSGVAVGALVTDKIEEVIELLHRLFANKMRYKLESHPERPGFLRLCEKLTGSVIRVQTDNELLMRTFWNNYHNRDKRVFPSLAAGKEAERLHE